MNRILIGLVLSMILLAACGRREGGGISSGTGGWPPSSSSSSPIEVSSSAQVVKVTTTPVEIAQNAFAEAIVKLSITPGYHVNANPATFPYLIPTEVRRIPEPDGFCARVGTLTYPAAKSLRFAFAETPLAVYEGDVEIKLPLRIPKRSESGCYGYPTSGAHGSLSFTVRVQACDDEKCYPPANLETTIPIEVK